MIAQTRTVKSNIFGSYVESMTTYRRISPYNCIQQFARLTIELHRGVGALHDKVEKCPGVINFPKKALRSTSASCTTQSSASSARCCHRADEENWPSVG
jgi:hypothetical protein